MKFSLITLAAALASTASASVLPRKYGYVPADHCCFELKDTSPNGRTLQQVSSGQTYLSTSSSASPYPYGWYCINFSDKNRGKVLIDDDWDACIVNDHGKLHCLDAIAGNDQWTLEGGLLVHDGNTEFTACRSKEGGESVGGPGQTGSRCRSLQLKVTKKKGAC